MKLIKYPSNTLNQHARSPIAETAMIDRAKIIDMGIYHKHDHPVKRFNKNFTISTQRSRLLTRPLYQTKAINRH
jgi:hypothetical protein